MYGEIESNRNPQPKGDTMRILTLIACLVLTACSDADSTRDEANNEQNVTVLGPSPLHCCDIVSPGERTTCHLLDGDIAMSDDGTLYCDTFESGLMQCDADSICYSIPSLLPSMTD